MTYDDDHWRYFVRAEGCVFTDVYIAENAMLAARVHLAKLVEMKVIKPGESRMVYTRRVWSEEKPYLLKARGER